MIRESPIEEQQHPVWSRLLHDNKKNEHVQLD